MFYFHKNGVTVHAVLGKDGLMRFSASKCSKKDQYNRKFGNMIARERLAKRKMFGYLNVDELGTLSPQEVGKVFKQHAEEICSFASSKKQKFNPSACLNLMNGLPKAKKVKKEPVAVAAV